MPELFEQLRFCSFDVFGQPVTVGEGDHQILGPLPDRNRDLDVGNVEPAIGVP